MNVICWIVLYTYRWTLHAVATYNNDFVTIFSINSDGTPSFFWLRRVASPVSSMDEKHQITNYGVLLSTRQGSWRPCYSPRIHWRNHSIQLVIFISMDVWAVDWWYLDSVLWLILLFDMWLCINWRFISVFYASGCLCHGLQVWLILWKRNVNSHNSIAMCLSFVYRRIHDQSPGNGSGCWPVRCGRRWFHRLSWIRGRIASSEQGRSRDLCHWSLLVTVRSFER